MSPDELREKVARAMMARSQLYAGLTWDDVMPATREMWLGDADAELAVVREAMREPSEEMCAEGAAAVDLEMYPANGMATTQAAARACYIMMLGVSPLREPGA